MLGCARIIATSSSAICDGPSSPIETPAWLPAILMLLLLIAAMRMKSLARDRNDAIVVGAEPGNRRAERFTRGHLVAEGVRGRSERRRCLHRGTRNRTRPR